MSKIYPAESTLECIRSWSYLHCDEVLDYIALEWHWPHMITSNLTATEAQIIDAEPNGQYLRLATGGWSGNEDLITALYENRMAWMLTWRLSARGGLHIFQYPEEVKR